jgi:hypothetical protein
LNYELLLLGQKAGVDVASAGEEVENGYADEMGTVLPHVCSIINNDHHGSIVVEQALQALQLVGVVLVAAQNAVAEVFAFRVDDPTHSLGIRASSHGVDVHFVFVRNPVEEVLETRAHFDIIPIRGHIGSIVVGELEALDILDGVVVGVLGVGFPFGDGALAGGVDDGLVKIDNQRQLVRAQQAPLGLFLAAQSLVVADEQGDIVVGHVDGGAFRVARLGEVVDLGHVLATVGAEAAKLDLVRAWLLDLDDVGPEHLSASARTHSKTWQSRSRSRRSLPGAREDGAGLDVPARDGALGARMEVRGEGPGFLVFDIIPVLLRHHALVRVGEEALGALHVVIGLLQQLEHGDGVVQTRGRCDLHSVSRRRMRGPAWARARARAL